MILYSMLFLLIMISVGYSPESIAAYKIVLNHDVIEDTSDEDIAGSLVV